MKRFLSYLCILSLAVGVCFGGAAAQQTCDLTSRKIFVDAGHGGSDPGAIGPTGLQEKDVNLDVALRLRDWLQGLGASVGMSRTTDIFIALGTRADLANSFGADRFISIHNNAITSPTANGTETYTVPNPSATTRDFGQQTLSYLLWYLGLRNRGLRTANFTVLLRTTMPAVLSESAFVTNPVEESLLADPATRALIAEAHAYAICQHLAASTATSGESAASSGATNSQRQAAYIRDGQVWVTGQGADTQLTSDDLVYSDVKVNSTQDKVLVTGSDFEGSRLFAIDLATGERSNLSMFGIGRAGDHNLSYEGFWSPDGSRILVLFARDDGHEQTAAELYLFDGDGRNPTRLTDDGAVKLNPAWTGDAQVSYETSDGTTITLDLP
ncbi:MAG: N-acetylmuramoyl-L-alanine amidase [Acidobacteriota bacterium]|nr:N-acetylmuramoyl-L-alanine amidase [Acidobacteriota bacterium]